MEIMKAYRTLIIFTLITSVCLGQESKTPQVTYNIPPDMLFDSPFMSSERGSGVENIKKGHRKLKIDIGF